MYPLWIKEIMHQLYVADCVTCTAAHLGHRVCHQWWCWWAQWLSCILWECPVLCWAHHLKHQTKVDSPTLIIEIYVWPFTFLQKYLLDDTKSRYTRHTNSSWSECKVCWQRLTSIWVEHLNFITYQLFKNKRNMIRQYMHLRRHTVAEQHACVTTILFF